MKHFVEIYWWRHKCVGLNNLPGGKLGSMRHRKPFLYDRLVPGQGQRGQHGRYTPKQQILYGESTQVY